MSVSMQSETSKDEIEPEEVELEDIVWNLMSRSGLLSQIQGQISKFIEDNGKAENVHIIRERADPKIIGLIFEYLQWVGMKQTNSTLLSESPVEIDLSTFESKDREDPEYRPELCKLLEDLNVTEEEEEKDKGSPTRSHNYSRDEFEDSKLTSESGLHEKHNESNDQVQADESQNEINSRTFDKTASIINKGEDEIDAVENPVEDLDERSMSVEENPSLTSTPNKSLNASVENEDNNSDMLINFNSPIIKGLDHTRPHVTLRQKLDVNLDPFQSPVAASKSGRLSMGANFTVMNPTTSFTEAPTPLKGDRSNSVEEINEEKENSERSKDNESVHSSKPERDLLAKVDFHLGAKDATKEEKDNEKQNESLKNAPQRSLDDDSTSDFMETLTMEEDTQDVSIASDSKGMSSCEHAVSLK